MQIDKNHPNPGTLFNYGNIIGVIIEKCKSGIEYNVYHTFEPMFSNNGIEECKFCNELIPSYICINNDKYIKVW